MNKSLKRFLVFLVFLLVSCLSTTAIIKYMEIHFMVVMGAWIGLCGFLLTDGMD